ncbi:hypothetical protein SBY92_004452 [Candida maltosa Xu316]
MLGSSRSSTVRGGPGGGSGGPGGNGSAANSSSRLLGAGAAVGTFRRLDGSNDDLERQDNADGDYAYRGVTTSNNLDSIFRSSGKNTSTSARNSTAYGGSVSNSDTHTRMNSYGHPLAHADDFNFNEEQGRPITRGGDTMSSSEYNDHEEESEDDGEFHPSDYDSFILPGEEHETENIFSGGNYGSNNSISRFHEEDVT